MDFWNKRHRFLAPIVAEVRQSGPWEQTVDGRPWRAAEMNFWNKRHRFLALIVSKVCQIGPCMLTKVTMFISRSPIEIQWITRKWPYGNPDILHTTEKTCPYNVHLKQSSRQHYRDGRIALSIHEMTHISTMCSGSSVHVNVVETNISLSISYIITKCTENSIHTKMI